MKKVFLVSFLSFLIISGAFIVERQSTSKKQGFSGLETVKVFDGPNDYVKPKIKEVPTPFDLEAASYAVAYDDGHKLSYLISKNPDLKRPIASITKISTAIAANETYTKDFPVLISAAAMQEGTEGRYSATDTIPVGDLIKSMLVESDNDAARALYLLGGDGFLQKMKKVFIDAGAKDATIFGASGIDDENGGTNIGTARDLISLMRFAYLNYPDIMDLTKNTEVSIFNSSGIFHHQAFSTNQLLSQQLPFEILAGKTGQTLKADKNLLLALRTSNGNVLYAVVLGSKDNFSDMKKLLEYVNNSFAW